MGIIHPENKLYERTKKGRTIQVVDRRGRRELRFGNRVVQSALNLNNPDSLILSYTQAMAAGMLLNPLAARILHIGLGGGSLPAFIYRNFPQAWQVVVELDPEVIETAYRFFGLPLHPRLKVLAADGGDYLSQCRDAFDLIFLDAYLAEGPAAAMEHQTTLGNIRDRLTADGWLINNIWGGEPLKMEWMVSRHLAVFPRLYSISVGTGANVILLGGKSPTPLNRPRMAEQEPLLSRKSGFDFSPWASRIQSMGKLIP
ncbi:MAG: hypothetical protein OEW12_00005 [Deltaproteobacteria bacterium]|nr:hypothetical protein [Deltaproteobacteria bacterium]